MATKKKATDAKVSKKKSLSDSDIKELLKSITLEESKRNKVTGTKKNSLSIGKVYNVTCIGPLNAAYPWEGAAPVRVDEEYDNFYKCTVLPHQNVQTTPRGIVKKQAMSRPYSITLDKHDLRTALFCVKEVLNYA